MQHSWVKRVVGLVAVRAICGRFVVCVIDVTAQDERFPFRASTFSFSASSFPGVKVTSTWASNATVARPWYGFHSP